jgi:integrase
MQLSNSLLFASSADLIDNRPERTGYDAKHYDEDEFNEYLAIVRDTKMELPVLLGGLYGLRRSEALGLRHSSINYKQEIITIQHTVTQAMVDGTLQTICADRTKNKSSKQSMPLLPQLIEAVKRAKERQAYYQKKLGKLYYTKDKDYLCLDETGHLLVPNYVSQKHKEILEKHGLRHIRYHDLRHSAATILIAHGVPLEYIQQFMRHATIDMTQRYAHLNVDKVLQDTASVIGKLIK